MIGGFSYLDAALVAIVAISGIALLKAFLEIGSHSEDDPFTQDDQRALMWQVIVHLTFVVSGVMLAFMDWLTGHQKSGH